MALFAMADHEMKSTQHLSTHNNEPKLTSALKPNNAATAAGYESKTVHLFLQLSHI